MAQNIYDDAEFFEGYSQLERSVVGLNGAVEWPSMRALLPDLSGRRVLDLGCGYGWFCRWAREQGAASVLGMDISEKMLARAAEMTSDAAITYSRADMEEVTLPAASFDFVYSSLAFHYIVALDRLLAQVAKALVPGGHLVFSVEHPIYTAPSDPHWVIDPEAHRRTWPIDRYQDEGPRTTDWITRGVIKQHRTLATYINLLLRLGFTLSHIEEWAPTDAEIAAKPNLAEERDRPTFLLIGARRALTPPPTSWVPGSRRGRGVPASGIDSGCAP